MATTIGTWWRIERYDARLVGLKVTRATAKRLFYVDAYGRSTWTDKAGYFENWAEAHDNLVQHLQERIKHHQNGIKETDKALIAVLKLKEPTQ